MRTPLLLLLPLATALFADQVVLKNGDTLTGNIVKKDGDKLTLHSDILGDVTMPWAAVTSIRTDQAVTVELANNERVSGKLTTSGDTLQVATESATRTAPLSQVAAVRNPAEQLTWERLQHPGLLQAWTGFFDTGFALARGNARTDTLTNAFNASRVTRHDKLSLSFNQIYGTARVNGTTSTIANAVRGGWSFDRNLSDRLFVTVMNDYDHNTFLDLDLRFVIGGGLGVNVIKTPTTTLSLLAAADYSRETFISNVHRNSAELNFGNDFLHKFSPTTSVVESFRVFPNLSESGEYRVNFDVGAVTAVKKWLGWHVTASDRFLSNPLFGRQRNDLIVSTGFRVSFARQ